MGTSLSSWFSTGTYAQAQVTKESPLPCLTDTLVVTYPDTVLPEAPAPKCPAAPRSLEVPFKHSALRRKARRKKHQRRLHWQAQRKRGSRFFPYYRPVRTRRTRHNVQQPLTTQQGFQGKQKYRRA